MAIDGYKEKLIMSSKSSEEKIYIDKWIERHKFSYYNLTKNTMFDNA